MIYPKKALYGLFVGTSVLALQSCGLERMLKKSKDQLIVVNPVPLELHGDSVKVDIELTLPTKMLKDNKIYALTVDYAYTDQRLPLGEMQFKGDEFPKKDSEQPKLKKSLAFPYKGAAMDRGELTFKGIASNVNGRQKATNDLTFGHQGLITTSRLVQDVYYATYAEHGYNNQEELTPTYVRFYFEQGKDKLRDVEIKGDRGKFLRAFVAAKNPTKTVVITGSHSPEGREVRNVFLSESRAKQIEKYYRDLMKKFSYKQKADSIKFIIRSQVQDWKPFLDSLAKSPDFTAAEKEEVTSLINGSSSNYVDTELKLQSLPVYGKLFKKLYPKLRNANTEILDIKPKKTDAQISILAKEISTIKKPVEALTEPELQYAGTLTPLLDERLAIYMAATKIQNSWKAHNNVASTYLEMALKVSGKDRDDLVNKAITHLELSKGIRETAVNQANLGSAYLMKGNRAKAMEALTRALDLKPDDATRRNINSMRGGVQIRAGVYRPAIVGLTDGNGEAVVAFNRGLANLLSRNFDAAMSAFNEAISYNANYALAHYGKAIVAARGKDEAEMAKSLRKAIQLDEKLRARAINDLEFVGFAGSDAFKNAVR